MEIYGDCQIETFKNWLRFSSDCQEQWLWESILDGCIFCPCFGGFMDVLLSDPWGGFLHIHLWNFVGPRGESQPMLIYLKLA